MAVIKVKMKNKKDIDKKPRVYFTCHPEDFEKYFDKICDDILEISDCAIYYTIDMTDPIEEEDKEADLARNNLFVIPVSRKLLTTPNRAMDEDFTYAIKEHIPILPIMMEPNIYDIYSKPNKFGELQYLNPYSIDLTAISYDEKLKRYLESVLISDEMAKCVRAAFDAYVFLSYRKIDRRYANELMRLIHKLPEYRDIAIWFDEFLTPGESFKENIERILSECKMFTLLVTPRLLEKVVDENGEERDNYVIGVEFPAARKKKTETGLEILAVEMEETDRVSLAAMEIDDYVNPINERVFNERLIACLSKIVIQSQNNNSKHNFMIGLAYLEGIDVEVDRIRALELISDAAETGLPEAMAKLISMHMDGIGVPINQDEALKWSDKLADLFFCEVFSKEDSIKSEDKLVELFSHYKNGYWAEAIKQFLLKVDKNCSYNTVQSLYRRLMNLGICEYTLFFETCKEMTQFTEETKIFLVTDILKKSASEMYPTYGPLFWYVPEYGLYEIMLLALDKVREDTLFAKMVALARDVCWIFGQIDCVEDITKRIDGSALLEAARKDLSGIRLALCELFYLGNTMFEGLSNIYPRCFNVGEAESRKKTGIGLWERMSVPFEDELGLYKHFCYNELDGELIGFISCPYHKPNIERLFNEKNMYKVKGLALTPTVNTVFTYMSIYRINISVIYFPENCAKRSRDSMLQMNLLYETYWDDTHLSYIIRKAKLVVPGNLVDVAPFGFSGFNWVEEIIFSDGVQTIGRKAFQGCYKLKKIIFPSTIIRIEPRLFLCYNLKRIVAPKSSYDLIVDRFEKKAKNIYMVRDLDNEWLEISISNVREGKNTYPIRLKSDTFLNIDLTEVKAKTTFLQDGTFEGHRNIQSVMLPSQLRKIYPRTFKNCISLMNVLMPQHLEVIEKSAFEGCTALPRIFLPDTLRYISDMAFKGCINLAKVFLPNSIQNIGREAFADCISLREIQIPPNIVYIASDAFVGCSSLSRIRIPVGFSLSLKLENNVQLKYYQPYFESKKNSLESDAMETDDGNNSNNFLIGDVSEIYISGDTLLSKGQFSGREDIKSVVIGEGICDIPKSCFADCVKLHTVKLASSVTRISASSFANCHSLTNIEFPIGLKSINESAFANCRKLQHIKFNNNLLQIGGQAFCGCSSLEFIELLPSIRRIGARAFLDCRSLQKIIISANYHDDIEKIFGDIDLKIINFIY